MTSIHLRTDRPGRLSPSTIPNTPQPSPSAVGRLAADMTEQLKLSLSDGVYHCPLPLHDTLKTVINSFSTRLLSSCTDEYARTYDISTYSVSSDRVS